MRVFVDTGAFVAAAVPRDQYYDRSLSIWRQVLDSADHVYSIDAVFQETMGLLRVRSGADLAVRWAEAQFQGEVIKWLPVDLPLRRAALPWMKKYADQGVSFVDAISFSLMRRENIQHVFSFDRHFTAAGFRLLQE